MTALMMANSRDHLNQLVQALDNDNEIIKERICFILGGFTDNRCINPLLTVLERNEGLMIKLAAIDSLQYFHDERIVPVLEHHLKIAQHQIKEAIIETLGEYIKHGVPNAHLPLVKLVKSDHEIAELRLLALDKINSMEVNEIKPLIHEFKSVSDAGIYAQVVFMEDNILSEKKSNLAKARKIVRKLIDEPDTMAALNLEDQLINCGTNGAQAIIDELFDSPQNTMLLTHTGMLIERLGVKAIPALKSLFESFNDFHEHKYIFTLQSLLSSIARPKYSALESSLLIFLKNLNQYIFDKKKGSNKEEYNILKADLHFALAKYGSEEGLQDMKALMDDGTERQFITFISAIRAIGDQDFLIPLINQYNAYRNSRSTQKSIRRAFLTIVKRQKIKRSDPMFDQLTGDQRKFLKEMTGK
ncbi:hypothetical protein GF337_07740 [candidate division KSB1 bacterium]|nr:hypothetical protein [candidate division KSB1 bacterium]